MHATLLLALAVTTHPAPADAPTDHVIDAPVQTTTCLFDPAAITDTRINFGVLADEPEEEAPEMELRPARKRFGAKGSRRWSLQAGYGVEGKERDNSLALGGAGVSWFIADGLSLDLELNGMKFNQSGDDGWGANLNLLFRWHFINERDWSMYLDGGAGLLLTANDVPDDGSSFNFTPQAGLGFSFALSDDIRLMTGVRWHHISNANTYEENPGRDSVMGYVGVSFPF
jgi:lipid A 3-O-deacylase